MFQTKFVEKVQTHFMFDNFFFEDHAVCEIIWKILEPDRPRVAMWLMRIAYWIPKNTNKEYNRSSTATMVARTPQCYVTRTQPCFYYIPFAKSYTTHIVSKRGFTLAFSH
jgi:hypothetical protein